MATKAKTLAPPVAIVGMHRSHTSLMAIILSRLGVDLGTGHYSNATSDNAEGYFEDLRFMALNDEVLVANGGAWDRPPALLNGWVDSEQMKKLRAKALKVGSTHARHAHWGWKDPRTTVTLGFWKSVFPEIKCVLCLRHPSEVAQSLESRRYASMPYERGLNLWLQYHEALLAALGDTPYLVAHSIALFKDAPDEIVRIAEFLGLEPTAAQIDDAAASIRTDLTGDSAVDYALPPDVEHVYRKLREQAGPVADKYPDPEPREGPLTPEEAAKMIASLRKKLSRKAAGEIEDRALIDEYSAQIKRVEGWLEDERKTVASLNDQHQELLRLYRNLEKEALEKHEKIIRMTLEIGDLQNQLEIEKRDTELRVQTIKTLEQMLADKGNEAANFMRERDDLQKLADERLEHIKSMESSLSWRMTKPLRRGKG